MLVAVGQRADRRHCQRCHDERQWLDPAFGSERIVMTLAQLGALEMPWHRSLGRGHSVTTASYLVSQ